MNATVAKPSDIAALATARQQAWLADAPRRKAEQEAAALQKAARKAEQEADRKKKEHEKRVRRERRARWLKEALGKEGLTKPEDLEERFGFSAGSYLDLRENGFSHENAINKCILYAMHRDVTCPNEVLSVTFS